MGSDGQSSLPLSDGAERDSKAAWTPALTSRVALVLASRCHPTRAAAFGWLIAVFTPSAVTARIAAFPLPMRMAMKLPPAPVLMTNAFEACSADDPPPVNRCVLAVRPLPLANVAPDTFTGDGNPDVAGDGVDRFLPRRSGGAVDRTGEHRTNAAVGEIGSPGDDSGTVERDFNACHGAALPGCAYGRLACVGTI
jgi:hypothetical protein